MSFTWERRIQVRQFSGCTQLKCHAPKSRAKKHGNKPRAAPPPAASPSSCLLSGAWLPSSRCLSFCTGMGPYLIPTVGGVEIMGVGWRLSGRQGQQISTILSKSLTVKKRWEMERFQVSAGKRGIGDGGRFYILFCLKTWIYLTADWKTKCFRRSDSRRERRDNWCVRYLIR